MIFMFLVFHANASVVRVVWDCVVGQIMDVLDKQGLAEKTLIILSNDSGPVVDDGYDDEAEELLNGYSPAGPWRGNKYSAFEGGTLT